METVKLTEKQKSEVFLVVVAAYDNCGSNADYETLHCCIESLIYSDRYADERVLNALFAEATRILKEDKKA
jgi:hypothetical protein